MQFMCRSHADRMKKAQNHKFYALLFLSKSGYPYFQFDLFSSK